jgi:hypothetical protein
VRQTYEVLRNAVFHVLCGPWSQDAGTPSILAVLTSKSDLGPGGKPRSAQTVLSHSKSRADLGCCKVLIQQYSAIAVLATCPRTQGYRKSQFFRTYCRSGRPQTQANCEACSKAIHSANYYNLKTSYKYI